MAKVHNLLLPRPSNDKERQQAIDEYVNSLKRLFATPDGETVLQYWVDEHCMSCEPGASHERLSDREARRAFVLEILEMTRGDEK